MPDDQDDTPRLTRSHRQRTLSGNSPSPEPERPSALPSNGSQHDERAKAFPRHLDFSPRDSPPAGSPASSSSQYPADSPLYTSSRLASPKDEADDAGSAGSRYSEEVEQNSDGNSSELSWRGIDYPNNSPPKSALLSQEFERLEGMGLFDPFAEDGEVDRIPDFGTAAKAPGNRVSDGELSNWMRRPAGSEQGSPKKLQGGGNWWDQAGDFNPGEGNQNWELLRDENGKDSSHENRSHTVEDVSPSQVGLVLQGIPSETGQFFSLDMPFHIVLTPQFDSLVHVAKPQPSSYQPRRPSGSATPPASYTPDPIESPAQGHRPLSSPAASSQVSLSLDTNLPPVVNIVRQPQISSTRSSSRASSHRLSTSLNYASQPTTPIFQAPPDLASVLESPRNPAIDDPPSPPLGPSITAVLDEPRPFENSVHTQEYFAPIVPETEPARARSPLKERASKKERSSTLPILSAKSTRRSPVLANPTSREAPPEIPPSSNSTASSTLGLDLSPNSGGMSASRLSSASDFADAYGNFTNDDDMAMYSPIQAPPVDPPLDATAPQFREFAHSSENSNLSIIEELDAQLSEAIQNIDFGSPSTSLADHQQFVPTLVLPQPSSLGSDETHPREGGPPSPTTLVEAPSTTPARTDAKARAVAFIEDLKRARAAAALQLASTPSPPLPPEAPPKAASIDPERSTPDSSMDMTPRATPAVEHFSSSKSPLAPESPLPRLPSATGTGGGGSTLGASHALQTVTATLSPPRTSGTPPISRKRLLPLATHTQDLRQAGTSAERSRLYASKIESLMRADSGLCSWSSFIRDRKSPQGELSKLKHKLLLVPIILTTLFAQLPLPRSDRISTLVRNRLTPVRSRSPPDQETLSKRGKSLGANSVLRISSRLYPTPESSRRISTARSRRETSAVDTSPRAFRRRRVFSAGETAFFQTLGGKVPNGPRLLFPPPLRPFPPSVLPSNIPRRLSRLLRVVPAVPECRACIDSVSMVQRAFARRRLSSTLR